VATAATAAPLRLRRRPAPLAGMAAPIGGAPRPVACAVAPSGVEAIEGVRAELEPIIRAAAGRCLTRTDLQARRLHPPPQPHPPQPPRRATPLLSAHAAPRCAADAGRAAGGARAAALCSPAT